MNRHRSKSSLSRRSVLSGSMGITLALAGSPIGRAGAAGDALTSRISETAEALMREHDIPGLAIGVATPAGSSIFPFGVMSRQGGPPVGPGTIFELGSVSKVYTAALAGLGYARGQLDWSDPVSRHLPELLDTPVGTASLMDLGTYSAGGLPLQFPDTVTDLETATEYFRGWRPEPGDGVIRRYSNPSLGLFGRAAAAAMGADFDTLMNRELLGGLGLTSTYTRVPDAALQDYAWGHDRDGRLVRVNPGVFDTEAYGIKASTSDVVRFLELNLDVGSSGEPFREALLQTRIPRLQVGPMIQGLGWEQYGRPASLEQLLEGNSGAMIMRPQPATPVGATDVGRGWLFNKTGSTGGFGAYLAFVPEAGIGVALLANRNFPIPARVAAAHGLLSAMSDA